MTTPANDEMAPCQQLAAWLASVPAEKSSALLSALPAVLANHVGECLSCYRFSLEWRELPQVEVELRALLLADQEMRETHLEQAQEIDDEAFWRQLPARVYQEVASPKADPSESPSRSSGGRPRPRSPLFSGWWSRSLAAALGGAAFAALTVMTWQSVPTKTPPGEASHLVTPERPTDDQDVAEVSSSEPSWVGALADLGPHALTGLLQQENEALGEQGDDAWQEIQEWRELDDAWGAPDMTFDEAVVTGARKR